MSIGFDYESVGVESVEFVGFVGILGRLAAPLFAHLVHR